MTMYDAREHCLVFNGSSKDHPTIVSTPERFDGGIINVIRTIIVAHGT